MCGIVFFHGPNARRRLGSSLRKLVHRGPDDQRQWHKGESALGFTRLAINGNWKQGRQPYYCDGWVGAINGQIYNHQLLRAHWGLSEDINDTSVVLPLLARHGVKILELLDGSYAAVAFQPARQRVLCLRDYIGKKPLLMGRSGSEVFITSELKAIDNIEFFEQVPLGLTELDLNTGKYRTLGGHNIDTSIVEREHPQRTLRTLLTSAVEKRMPASSQPVGLFLSGGLDSALIAALSKSIRSDIVHFVLGDKHSPDVAAAFQVAKSLNLQNICRVPLPTPEQLTALVADVVYATESYNPSIVSNGVAAYLLAREAHRHNIKVVLTGEGADELFGGYHHFKSSCPWQAMRQRLMQDLHYTELRRLDLSCMAHSVEPRCPYLDRYVFALSKTLDYPQLYGRDYNKVLLRESFKGSLPNDILHRQKISCDVGSGIRGRIVPFLRQGDVSEREALKVIWQEHFTHDALNDYSHRYRAFDEVIEQRGTVHR